MLHRFQDVVNYWFRFYRQQEMPVFSAHVGVNRRIQACLIWPRKLETGKWNVRSWCKYAQTVDAVQPLCEVIA